jgi:acyl-CoA carboxylase epsilon subunit
MAAVSSDPTTADGADSAAADKPVLRIVSGDATAEEVAALVAVLSALQTTAAPAPRPTPAWSAPHRKVRTTLPHGRGGWRSSALPR